MSRPQEKTFGIGITLVIAAIITIAIFSYRQTRKVNFVTARIDYTRNVLSQLSDLYTTVIEHAGSARNYSLNGKEEDISRMQSTASALLLKLGALKNLVQNNPGQQTRTDSLAKYIIKRIEFSNQIITAGKNKGIAAASELYQTGAGRDYNNLVLSFIQKMQGAELVTLRQDEQKNATSIKHLGNYLLGLFIFILVLILIIIQKSRLDKELRKSEERYKVLIEQASDAIMITDHRGNFSDVNTSFCNEFGYTKDELMGLNVSKVMDPEQLRTDPIRFDLLLAGQTISRERRMMHKNSGIIEVEANVKMLPDGRMLAIARNITERKKNAEEKERVRYLLNERVKELTTLYRAGQILQSEYKSPELVLKEIISILPDGWQYPGIAAARITLGESSFATPNFAESPYRQYARFQTPDGQAGIVEVVYLEERPAENEGPFLAEERNLINMISEMLRIFFVRKGASDLLLKEKNLSESVINSLPGIFYFVDYTGRFIRWNKRFETVSGYSADEISKMRPMAFFEDDDKAYVKNRIAEVFQKGLSDAEALFLTKDKRKIPYYFTGASVEIGGIPYLLGTGIDITERRKAEEELRVSRENLKRSYEEIRLLASNIENIREEEKIKIAREIHDELGQQLTGLKMDVAWLGKKLDPKDTLLAKKIKDILSLLDETVKSIRRIASELRPGLLDDLGLVAAIEWHSQEFQKRSGIKTRFILPVKDIVIPPAVSTGLFRIFQESLTNIARHAEAGEIVASLEQAELDVILKVSDNGKGFDTNGTGDKKTLGLLGMKERAMMMGGKFEIISEAGNGTTVIVSVPLIPDQHPKNKIT
ncbi:MAG: PAS domain S-box protein [Bacteroidota bacterium]|nr:PAS domain S-box protein [Bacteroidota bacterium]